MENKYLTAQDVMQKLQLSRNVVYKLLKNGDIPAKKLGRSYRIVESDLDSFMKNKTEEE